MRTFKEYYNLRLNEYNSTDYLLQALGQLMQSYQNPGGQINVASVLDEVRGQLQDLSQNYEVPPNINQLISMLIQRGGHQVPGNTPQGQQQAAQYNQMSAQLAQQALQAVQQWQPVSNQPNMFGDDEDE